MFASRAAKLDHALTAFDLNVTGLNCADLGSNTGGFVDCLLQRGAAKVFAIDAGYGGSIGSFARTPASSSWNAPTPCTQPCRKKLP